MKKKFIYAIAILLFFTTVAFIGYQLVKSAEQEDIAFYGLLERKGPLAHDPEWAGIRQTASTLFRATRENPDDKRSALGLAALFLQEARITGNNLYYEKAALQQVARVLKKDPANFEALTFRALIELSRHHFSDALETAQKAVKINPYNAFIYGILLDTHVELGNYREAVENAEKMISLRPDLRSYSRISYLREIHGDYPGAIEAMKLAVDAGRPGDEATEWCRVHLGRLYEHTGDGVSAEIQYTCALRQRPFYAHALAGLGRVARWRKNYSKAIHYFVQADSLIHDVSIKEELLDAFLLAGQPQKADSVSALVLSEMNVAANAGPTGEHHGHFNDLEQAAACLKVNKVNKALGHALAEYSRRPRNIEVNETLARAYYCKGDAPKAVPFIRQALKTGCKDPTLLCYAGLIFRETGDSKQAQRFLEAALKNNPIIDEALKNKCRMALLHPGA